MVCLDFVDLACAVVVSVVVVVVVSAVVLFVVEAERGFREELKSALGCSRGL